MKESSMEMNRVTVFLRTNLFSFSGPEKHVPSGVMVIEGHVIEQNAIGITIETDHLLDDRGRILSEASLKLVLPHAKIDHMLLLEG